LDNDSRVSFADPIPNPDEEFYWSHYTMPPTPPAFYAEKWGVPSSIMEGYNPEDALKMKEGQGHPLSLDIEDEGLFDKAPRSGYCDCEPYLVCSFPFS
jgi:hypothetical protein